MERSERTGQTAAHRGAGPNLTNAARRRMDARQDRAAAHRAAQDAADTDLAWLHLAPDAQAASAADAAPSAPAVLLSLERVVTAERAVLAAAEQLRLTAETLSRSLRSPNTRGRWGEIQLKRIVELAGMVEHCDFEQQELGDDSRLKPDMTVRLPGGTRIVVDAKVPIEAYMRAVEAAHEDARGRFLDEHAAQVKQHIKALGNKKYWEQFKDAGPEFVVMFLPLEPLMSAAFERDGELLEFAARENVVLATPMTLLALLRAVAFGWQQQSLARNAAEIRGVGQELCERLITMVKHFDDAGSHLAGAVESFNKAVSSFDRRVMPSVRRFQDLKVPLAEKIEAPEERPAVLKTFQAQQLLELPEPEPEPNELARR